MIKFLVREIAEGQGLNIQGLSDKSGIAYSTIVDVWYDRTRRIDKATLSRLCAALQATPGELLEYVEDEEADSKRAPDLVGAAVSST